MDSESRLRVCAGSTRYSLGWSVRGAEGTSSVSRRPVEGGGGGDEETRTPDLLLAKEMLFQLSYVPLATWRPGA